MESLFLIGGLVLGYLIYAKGIRDGIALEKGHKPAITPQPIKKARERKQEKASAQAEAELASGVEKLMSWDGYSNEVGDLNG